MARGKRESIVCIDDMAIQTQGNKKIKKFQNAILCRNTECPRIKVMTAGTEPLEKTNLTHPEGRVAVKKRKSKPFVNMQGDSNSPDQKNLFKSSKRKKVKIVEPELKKYVHRGDIDDFPVQKQGTTNDKNKNLPDDDRLSLKSMLKRSKTYPYSKRNCACVGKIIYTDEKAQTETPLNKNKKIGKKKHNREIAKGLDEEIPKTDIKLVMKPKPNDEKIKKKEDKKSPKSKSPSKKPCVCPKDTKKNENVFVDASAKRETMHCNDGICSKTDNFWCRCLKKIQQSERTTNDKSISPNSPEPARASKLPEFCEPTCRKPCLKESLKTKNCEPSCRKSCFKDLLMSKFRSGSHTFDHLNTKPYNQCEQTGEPFMEIKVNAVNMSVLNPNEIKGKVIDLSKKCKANPTCLCRSHQKRRDKMMDMDLCEGGICHKTFRNKKLSFNCKCEKIGECSDNTCNGTFEPNSRPPHGWPTVSLNPDFEVKLDSKQMHVLNPETVHRKIMDMETESKELSKAICPDGMCGAAKANNETYFKCKCIERKRKPEEIRECSEATCAEEGARYSGTEQTDLVCCLLAKVQSILGGKRNRKMPRRSNSNELGKKSFFSMSSRPKRKRRSAPNPNAYPRNHGMHRREGLKINLSKTHPDTCTCNVCNAKVQTSLGERCKSFIESSISGLLALTNRNTYTVNPFQNYHRRNDVSFPPRSQPQRIQQRHTQYHSPSGNFAQVTDMQTEEEKQAEIEKKYNKNNICACSNICECADIMDKERRKKKEKQNQEYSKQKHHRKKSKQKQKQFKEQSKQKHKHQLDLEKDKEFRKLDKASHQLQVKKDKIEAKRRVKQLRAEQKEMKELSKQDETTDTNCLADFIIGFLRVTFNIVKGVLIIFLKGIFKPRRSYKYIRQRMRDPEDTWNRFNLWLSNRWVHQKFRMNRTIKGSRTMAILSDEVKENEVFKAFAFKGKTPEEKRFVAAADKRRRKRILKRHNEALYGCQHMLLVTMRKRPCLWVYHICPGIYPQFLSARMFVLNFCQMLLFCVAVLVWTPCIACCELCRGVLCCMVCTR